MTWIGIKSSIILQLIRAIFVRPPTGVISALSPSTFILILTCNLHRSLVLILWWRKPSFDSPLIPNLIGWKKWVSGAVSPLLTHLWFILSNFPLLSIHCQSERLDFSCCLPLASFATSLASARLGSCHSRRGHGWPIRYPPSSPGERHCPCTPQANAFFPSYFLFSCFILSSSLWFIFAFLPSTL